jgi:hypothetical protein
LSCLAGRNRERVHGEDEVLVATGKLADPCFSATTSIRRSTKITGIAAQTSNSRLFRKKCAMLHAFRAL